MNEAKRQSKLSPDEQREARIAGLIVIGLLMFIFEAYLPRPVPWLKLGLANIATLIALYWIDWRAATTVTVFRIVIGSFFAGGFLSPGFFLSLSGGLLSIGLMALMHKSGIFGILAVSVAGALAHNFAQLAVAVTILFDNDVLWYLWPYMVLTALTTGGVIGWISHVLLRRLAADFESL